MASPATVDNQVDHPAGTCSPSMFLGVTQSRIRLRSSSLLLASHSSPFPLFKKPHFVSRCHLRHCWYRRDLLLKLPLSTRNDHSIIHITFRISDTRSMAVELGIPQTDHDTEMEKPVVFHLKGHPLLHIVVSSSSQREVGGEYMSGGGRWNKGGFLYDRRMEKAE
ncbi:hypothetical protein L2E82_22789 [Cichorium intybus]|uniref:Uncharacterized protein n=1 Tax=Cichorium intybus TaxID=13427 RepID=A0ACB9DZD9_CICIN|nr:hypothetical protein L2E82_22789 [Cichorium intybus]